jgi:hypothetical protein
VEREALVLPEEGGQYRTLVEREALVLPEVGGKSNQKIKIIYFPSTDTIHAFIG